MSLCLCVLLCSCVAVLLDVRALCCDWLMLACVVLFLRLCCVLTLRCPYFFHFSLFILCFLFCCLCSCILVYVVVFLLSCFCPVLVFVSFPAFLCCLVSIMFSCCCISGLFLYLFMFFFYTLVRRFVCLSLLSVSTYLSLRLLHYRLRYRYTCFYQRSISSTYQTTNLITGIPIH